MKLRRILWAVLLLPLLAACSQPLEPALEVIGRVAPWSRGKVEVKQMKAPKGCQDAYELSTQSGKLIIRATSIPAAGMGFNHYLKHYCHQNYSLTGKNIQPIDVLPEIEGKVRHETTDQYRHFFNFCTLNYSAAWWDWADWQEAIDYMVLNGVNLTLAPIGVEKVWYNTLQRIGFSQEEIFDFLPGPAFNAWHLMGNLEGWGGPINLDMVEKRAELAKKVIDAERKYGINPIYMSFYGMVPTTLKEKFPNAQILPQGNWVGGFLRPDILSPLDPLYDQMAGIYYEEINKNYGEFKFFAGEPFHEGGDRAGIDEATLSRTVLGKMREYNPGCQWILQSWGDNPSSKFLSGLSKTGDAIIWDFRGEQAAVWEDRGGYDGFPFLWGTINNFGETTGLYGQLQRFVDEYYRAKKICPGNMIGIGCSAEGVLNNPVNYELLFELPWHDETFSLDEWIRSYAAARYGGQLGKDMEPAWRILLQTAYSSQSAPVQPWETVENMPAILGNPESVICAPPSLEVRSASSWGTSHVFYDLEALKQIIPYLANVATELDGNDALEYDVVNITRQLLANEFYRLYHEYVQCVEKGQLGPSDALAPKMLEIIGDMDKLLSSRRDFMIGPWINAARNFGNTDSEKRLCEWNARALISYWGGESDTTDLRDYAFKEWSGIMRDLYLPRWKEFFEACRLHITNGRSIKNNPTLQSMAWAHATNRYPNTPTHDSGKMVTLILAKLAEGKY